MSRENERACVGIIGGSGIRDFAEMEGRREIERATRFGAPSSKITLGTVADVEVAFISRHGPGHSLAPDDVPSRANILALALLGVEEVISLSAVGSLREDVAPGDLLVPDQLVDLTTGRRPRSFFEAPAVGHVAMADPYCPRLRGHLGASAREVAGRTVHDGGTYIVVPGPRFSTRAESELYRRWGMDVIGMTAMPEAVLAREAGLCYASLSLVTDYDCWRPVTEAVTADEVASVMRRNEEAAVRVVLDVLRTGSPRSCSCREALTHAVLTDRSALGDRVLDFYEFLGLRS